MEVVVTYLRLILVGCILLKSVTCLRYSSEICLDWGKTTINISESDWCPGEDSIQALLDQ
jgi:hypothetical protein